MGRKGDRSRRRRRGVDKNPGGVSYTTLPSDHGRTEPRTVGVATRRGPTPTGVTRVCPGHTPFQSEGKVGSGVDLGLDFLTRLRPGCKSQRF